MRPEAVNDRNRQIFNYYEPNSVHLSGFDLRFWYNHVVRSASEPSGVSLDAAHTVSSGEGLPAYGRGQLPRGRHALVPRLCGGRLDTRTPHGEQITPEFGAPPSYGIVDLYI